MKVPHLTDVEEAGVRPWSGSTEPLRTAASHAQLAFALVDLAHASEATIDVLEHQLATAEPLAADEL